MTKFSPGYTLFEILVASAVFAITVTIIFSMASGTRQKVLLEQHRDELVKALEFAKQQSIAAYKGRSYGVLLQPPNKYQIEPGSNLKTLNPSVSISLPTANTLISFKKVTGKPDNPQNILLKTGQFQTTITIDNQGNITKTLVAKP